MLKEKSFVVGDYVEWNNTIGRGFVYRVVDVSEIYNSYAKMLGATVMFSYKIKPVYGMFKSAKNKKSHTLSEYQMEKYVKKLDLLELAAEHLKLGNFIKLVASERGMEQRTPNDTGKSV